MRVCIVFELDYTTQYLAICAFGKRSAHRAQTLKRLRLAFSCHIPENQLAIDGGRDGLSIVLEVFDSSNGCSVLALGCQELLGLFSDLPKLYLTITASSQNCVAINRTAQSAHTLLTLAGESNLRDTTHL